MSDSDDSLQAEGQDDDIRALRQLVDEVRREPPPALDWDGVEERLMARVSLEAAARKRRPDRSRSWPKALGFVAAAAALLLMVAHSDDDAQPAVALQADTVVDLSTLTTSPHDGGPSYQVSDLGARSAVESGAEPVRFSLPGVVSWTLSPNSRLRVLTVDAPHRVNLERGTIRAQVVPHGRSDRLVESFVVETAGTRVAVHGTVFSVERHVDRVTVEVNRGSVTVGPAGQRGVTSGRVMVGPLRASFGLDGSFLELLPTPTPLAAAQPQVGAEPQRPSAERGAAAPRTEAQDDGMPPQHAGLPPQTPTPPSAEAPEPSTSTADDASADMTVAQARALVAGCLDASTRGNETDTLVTVSSRVTAFLDADGQVQSVQFVPPMRPDLQSRCGATLFGHAIAATGSSISFDVQASY